MSAYREPGKPGLPVVEYAYEYDRPVRVHQTPVCIVLEPKAPPPALPEWRRFERAVDGLYVLSFIVAMYLVAILAFR